MSKDTTHNARRNALVPLEARSTAYLITVPGRDLQDALPGDEHGTDPLGRLHNHHHNTDDEEEQISQRSNSYEDVLQVSRICMTRPQVHNNDDDDGGDDDSSTNNASPPFMFPGIRCVESTNPPEQVFITPQLPVPARRPHIDIDQRQFEAALTDIAEEMTNLWEQPGTIPTPTPTTPDNETAVDLLIFSIIEEVLLGRTNLAEKS